MYSIVDYFGLNITVVTIICHLLFVCRQIRLEVGYHFIIWVAAIQYSLSRFDKAQNPLQDLVRAVTLHSADAILQAVFIDISM